MPRSDAAPPRARRARPACALTDPPPAPSAPGDVRLKKVLFGTNIDLGECACVDKGCTCGLDVSHTLLMYE